MLFQPAMQVAVLAPVGRLGHIIADNHPEGSGLNGFHIIAIRAGIANMGKGKGDDLSGIGRVSHNFLIAGHRGVEANLANIRGFRAKARTIKGCAIFK